jgi:hypothetical protein
MTLKELNTGLAEIGCSDDTVVYFRDMSNFPLEIFDEHRNAVRTETLQGKITSDQVVIRLFVNTDEGR